MIDLVSSSKFYFQVLLSAIALEAKPIVIDYLDLQWNTYALKFRLLIAVEIWAFAL